MRDSIGTRGAAGSGIERTAAADDAAGAAEPAGAASSAGAAGSAGAELSATVGESAGGSAGNRIS